MTEEQKFNELIKLKKQTSEKLSTATDKLKKIESEIETLKSEISQIDAEIGIMRGVDIFGYCLLVNYLYYAVVYSNCSKVIQRG